MACVALLMSLSRPPRNIAGPISQPTNTIELASNIRPPSEENGRPSLPIPLGDSSRPSAVITTSTDSVILAGPAPEPGLIPNRRQEWLPLLKHPRSIRYYEFLGLASK